MTHRKKTPVKRRAIEGRGFVGVFIVLPERRFCSIGRKNDTATLRRVFAPYAKFSEDRLCAVSFPD